jgi:hypothetical protein
VFDFNEISPSKLLRNNIKVKEKFCVVFVCSSHKSAQIPVSMKHAAVDDGFKVGVKIGVDNVAAAAKQREIQWKQLNAAILIQVNCECHDFHLTLDRKCIEVIK